MNPLTIDDLDRKIIQALFLDPRASFSRLSSVLATSEQTVARRYRRLFEHRVLRVVGQLDAQRLGRSDWVVRIRCAAGSAPTVAAKLAAHPDTSWVMLTSGGTEIFGTVHARDVEHHTPLLLSQLSVGRHVVGLEAYCLLHLYTTGVSAPPVSDALSEKEVSELGSSKRARNAYDRTTVRLQDSDWPLVHALAEDGRATYRQLALRTHWHESTVRRRIEELTVSGMLSFDVDLDSAAIGVRSNAVLWMSVAPGKLVQVGEALASSPQVPFVAATTGSTNLVAALLCKDDRSLYEFITDKVSALEGLTHVETAPVMRAVKMHATMAPPGRDAMLEATI